MSKFPVIFVMLGLWCGSLLAQNTEAELDQIRNCYKDVNAHLAEYKMVELANAQISQDSTSDKYSIEGSETYRPATARITKFYDGEDLAKLVVTFEGDREQLVSHYYFRQGKLFFVDKLKTIYHRPKWHHEFDATNTSIDKNRFYFNDDTLLKWVDAELLSIGKTNPHFSEQESTIVSDVHVYLAIRE